MVQDCVDQNLKDLRGEKPFRSRYSYFFRSLSAFIIFAFLLQDFASAQGGTPLWSEVTPSRSSSTNSPRTSLDKITIPDSAGLTRKVVANGSGDVIINIQDAHSKLGAQESITEILDNLVRNYNLSLIALEGASDLVDTSLVSSFPIEEVREKTGRYLLKEGKISAGEFYSMISKEPVKLYGVDDPELYKGNLEAFRALVDNKLKIRNELKALGKVLADLEKNAYSPELLELADKKLLQRNGEIKFTEYWERFSKVAHDNGVDYGKFKNLKKLADTVELEKEIDFKKAQKQRDALIEELGKKLPKPELERLVLQSLQFKQGKITPGAFHYYLSQVSQGNAMDPAQYKDLIFYAKYVVLYEDIDLIAIFDEVESFEGELREKLFRTEDERSLSNLSRCVRILSQLLDTTLTDKDYEFFIKNPSSCDIEDIRINLQALAAKYHTSFEGRINFEVLLKSIPDAKEFYRLAEARNKALLENTMKRMKEENTHVAALITGGFHSEGISKLMDNEQLSYLVVMPKFDDKSPNRPYIAILTQKPKEYEKAFEDSDFYLAAAQSFDLAHFDIETAKLSVATALREMGKYLRVRRLPEEVINSIVETYRTRYEANGRGGIAPDEFAKWLNNARLSRAAELDTVELSGLVYSYTDERGGSLKSVEVRQADTGEFAAIDAEELKRMQGQIDMLQDRLGMLSEKVSRPLASQTDIDRWLPPAVDDAGEAFVADARNMPLPELVTAIVDFIEARLDTRAKRKGQDLSDSARREILIAGARLAESLKGVETGTALIYPQKVREAEPALINIASLPFKKLKRESAESAKEAGARLANAPKLPFDEYGMFKSFYPSIFSLMEKIDFKSKVVLDLGAGEGALTQRAFELGAQRVVLVEISREAANKAKERLGRLQINGKNLKGRIITSLNEPIEADDDYIIVQMDILDWIRADRDKKMRYLGSERIIQISNLQPDTIPGSIVLGLIRVDMANSEGILSDAVAGGFYNHLILGNHDTSDEVIKLKGAGLNHEIERAVLDDTTVAEAIRVTRTGARLAAKNTLPERFKKMPTEVFTNTRLEDLTKALSLLTLGDQTENETAGPLEALARIVVQEEMSQSYKFDAVKYAETTGLTEDQVRLFRAEFRAFFKSISTSAGKSKVKAEKKKIVQPAIPEKISSQIKKPNLFLSNALKFAPLGLAAVVAYSLLFITGTGWLALLGGAAAFLIFRFVLPETWNGVERGNDPLLSTLRGFVKATLATVDFLKNASIGLIHKIKTGEILWYLLVGAAAYTIVLPLVGTGLAAYAVVATAIFLTRLPTILRADKKTRWNQVAIAAITAIALAPFYVFGGGDIPENPISFDNAQAQPPVDLVPPADPVAIQPVTEPLVQPAVTEPIINPVVQTDYSLTIDPRMTASEFIEDARLAFRGTDPTGFGDSVLNGKFGEVVHTIWGDDADHIRLGDTVHLRLGELPREVLERIQSQGYELTPDAAVPAPSDVIVETPVEPTVTAVEPVENVTPTAAVETASFTQLTTSPEMAGADIFRSFTFYGALTFLGLMGALSALTLVLTSLNKKFAAAVGNLKTSTLIRIGVAAVGSILVAGIVVWLSLLPARIPAPGVPEPVVAQSTEQEPERPIEPEVIAEELQPMALPAPTITGTLPDTGNDFLNVAMRLVGNPKLYQERIVDPGIRYMALIDRLWLNADGTAPSQIIYSIDPQTIFEPLREFRTVTDFDSFRNSPGVTVTTYEALTTDIRPADLARIAQDTSKFRQVGQLEIQETNRTYYYLFTWTENGVVRNGLVESGRNASEQNLQINAANNESHVLVTEINRILGISNPIAQANAINSSALMAEFGIHVEPGSASFAVVDFEYEEGTQNITGVRGFYRYDDLRPAIIDGKTVFVLEHDGRLDVLAHVNGFEGNNNYVFSYTLPSQPAEVIVSQPEVPADVIETLAQLPAIVEPGRRRIGGVMIGPNYLRAEQMAAQLNVAQTRRDALDAHELARFQRHSLFLAVILSFVPEAAPVANLVHSLADPDGQTAEVASREDMLEAMAEFYAIEERERATGILFEGPALQAELERVRGEWAADPSAKQAAMALAETRLDQTFSSDARERFLNYAERRQNESNVSYALTLIQQVVAVAGVMDMPSLTGDMPLGSSGQVGFSVNLQSVTNAALSGLSSDPNVMTRQAFANAPNVPRISAFFRGFPVFLIFAQDFANDVDEAYHDRGTYAFRVQNGFFTDRLYTYDEENFHMLQRIPIGIYEDGTGIQRPVYAVRDGNQWQVVMLTIAGAEDMAVEAARDVAEVHRADEVRTQGGITVDVSAELGTLNQRNETGLFASFNFERADAGIRAYTWDNALAAFYGIASGDLDMARGILDRYVAYIAVQPRFQGLPRSLTVADAEGITGQGPSVAVTAAIAQMMLHYQTRTGDTRYQSTIIQMAGWLEDQRVSRGLVRDSETDENAYTEPNAIVSAFFAQYGQTTLPNHRRFAQYAVRNRDAAWRLLWDPAAQMFRAGTSTTAFSADAQTRPLVTNGPQEFIRRLGLDGYAQYLHRVDERFGVDETRDSTTYHMLDMADRDSRVRSQRSPRDFPEVTAEFVRALEEATRAFRTAGLDYADEAVWASQRAAFYQGELDRLSTAQGLPQTLTPAIDTGFNGISAEGRVHLGATLQDRLTALGYNIFTFERNAGSAMPRPQRGPLVTGEMMTRRIYSVGPESIEEERRILSELRSTAPERLLFLSENNLEIVYINEQGLQRHVQINPTPAMRLEFAELLERQARDGRDRAEALRVGGAELRTLDNQPIRESGHVVRVGPERVTEILRWIAGQPLDVRTRIDQMNYAGFEYPYDVDGDGQVGAGEIVLVNLTIPRDFSYTAPDPMNNSVETRFEYLNARLMRTVTAQSITTYTYDEENNLRSGSETRLNTSHSLSEPIAGDVTYTTRALEAYLDILGNPSAPGTEPRFVVLEINSLTGERMINIYGSSDQPLTTINLTTNTITYISYSPDGLNSSRTVRIANATDFQDALREGRYLTPVDGAVVSNERTLRFETSEDGHRIKVARVTEGGLVKMVWRDLSNDGLLIRSTQGGLTSTYEYNRARFGRVATRVTISNGDEWSLVRANRGTGRALYGVTSVGDLTPRYEMTQAVGNSIRVELRWETGHENEEGHEIYYMAERELSSRQADRVAVRRINWSTLNVDSQSRPLMYIVTTSPFTFEGRRLLIREEHGVLANGSMNPAILRTGQSYSSVAIDQNGVERLRFYDQTRDVEVIRDADHSAVYKYEMSSGRLVLGRQIADVRVTSRNSDGSTTVERTPLLFNNPDYRQTTTEVYSHSGLLMERHTNNSLEIFQVDANGDVSTSIKFIRHPNGNYTLFSQGDVVASDADGNTVTRTATYIGGRELTQQQIRANRNGSFEDARGVIADNRQARYEIRRRGIENPIYVLLGEQGQGEEFDFQMLITNRYVGELADFSIAQSSTGHFLVSAENITVERLLELSATDFEGFRGLQVSSINLTQTLAEIQESGQTILASNNPFRGGFALLVKDHLGRLIQEIRNGHEATDTNIRQGTTVITHTYDNELFAEYDVPSLTRYEVVIRPGVPTAGQDEVEASVRVLSNESQIRNTFDDFFGTGTIQYAIQSPFVDAVLWIQGKNLSGNMLYAIDGQSEVDPNGEFIGVGSGRRFRFTERYETVFENEGEYGAVGISSGGSAYIYEPNVSGHLGELVQTSSTLSSLEEIARTREFQSRLTTVYGGQSISWLETKDTAYGLVQEVRAGTAIRSFDYSGQLGPFGIPNDTLIDTAYSLTRPIETTTVVTTVDEISGQGDPALRGMIRAEGYNHRTGSHSISTSSIEHALYPQTRENGGQINGRFITFQNFLYNQYQGPKGIPSTIQNRDTRFHDSKPFASEHQFEGILGGGLANRDFYVYRVQDIHRGIQGREFVGTNPEGWSFEQRLNFTTFPQRQRIYSRHGVPVFSTEVTEEGETLWSVFEFITREIDGHTYFISRELLYDMVHDRFVPATITVMRDGRFFAMESQKVLPTPEGHDEKILEPLRELRTVMEPAFSLSDSNTNSIVGRLRGDENSPEAVRVYRALMAGISDDDYEMIDREFYQNLIDNPARNQLTPNPLETPSPVFGVSRIPWLGIYGSIFSFFILLWGVRKIFKSPWIKKDESVSSPSTPKSFSQKLSSKSDIMSDDDHEITRAIVFGRTKDTVIKKFENPARPGESLPENIMSWMATNKVFLRFMVSKMKQLRMAGRSEEELYKTRDRYFVFLYWMYYYQHNVLYERTRDPRLGYQIVNGKIVRMQDLVNLGLEDAFLWEFMMVMSTKDDVELDTLISPEDQQLNMLGRKKSASIRAQLRANPAAHERYKYLQDNVLRGLEDGTDILSSLTDEDQSEMVRINNLIEAEKDKAQDPEKIRLDTEMLRQDFSIPGTLSDNPALSVGEMQFIVEKIVTPVTVGLVFSAVGLERPRPGNQGIVRWLRSAQFWTNLKAIAEYYNLSEGTFLQRMHNFWFGPQATTWQERARGLFKSIFRLLFGYIIPTAVLILTALYIYSHNVLAVMGSFDQIYLFGNENAIPVSIFIRDWIIRILPVLVLPDMLRLFQYASVSTGKLIIAIIVLILKASYLGSFFWQTKRYLVNFIMRESEYSWLNREERVELVVSQLNSMKDELGEKNEFEEFIKIAKDPKKTKRDLLNALPKKPKSPEAVMRLKIFASKVGHRRDAQMRSLFESFRNGTVPPETIIVNAWGEAFWTSLKSGLKNGTFSMFVLSNAKDWNRLLENLKREGVLTDEKLEKLRAFSAGFIRAPDDIKKFIENKKKKNKTEVEAFTEWVSKNLSLDLDQKDDSELIGRIEHWYNSHNQSVYGNVESARLVYGRMYHDLYRIAVLNKGADTSFNGHFDTSTEEGEFVQSHIAYSVKHDKKALEVRDHLIKAFGFEEDYQLDEFFMEYNEYLKDLENKGQNVFKGDVIKDRRWLELIEGFIEKKYTESSGPSEVDYKKLLDNQDDLFYLDYFGRYFDQNTRLFAVAGSYAKGKTGLPLNLRKMSDFQKALQQQFPAFASQNEDPDNIQTYFDADQRHFDGLGNLLANDKFRQDSKLGVMVYNQLIFTTRLSNIGAFPARGMGLQEAGFVSGDLEAMDQTGSVGFYGKGKVRAKVALSTNLPFRAVAEDLVLAIAARAKGWKTSYSDLLTVGKGLPTMLSAALIPLFKWAGDSAEWFLSLEMQLLRMSPNLHWAEKESFNDTANFWFNEPVAKRFVIFSLIVFLMATLNPFALIPIWGFAVAIHAGVIAKTWGALPALMRQEGILLGLFLFLFWLPLLVVWASILMPHFDIAVTRGYELYAKFIPTGSKGGLITADALTNIYQSLLPGLKTGSVIAAMLLVLSFSLVGTTLFFPTIVSILAFLVGPYLLNFGPLRVIQPKPGIIGFVVALLRNLIAGVGNLVINMATALVFASLALIDALYDLVTWFIFPLGMARRWLDRNLLEMALSTLEQNPKSSAPGKAFLDTWTPLGGTAYSLSAFVNGRARERASIGMYIVFILSISGVIHARFKQEKKAEREKNGLPNKEGVITKIFDVYQRSMIGFFIVLILVTPNFTLKSLMGKKIENSEIIELKAGWNRIGELKAVWDVYKNRAVIPIGLWGVPTQELGADGKARPRLMANGEAQLDDKGETYARPTRAYLLKLVGGSWKKGFLDFLSGIPGADFVVFGLIPFTYRFITKFIPNVVVAIWNLFPRRDSNKSTSPNNPTTPPSDSASGARLANVNADRAAKELWQESRPMFDVLSKSRQSPSFPEKPNLYIVMGHQNLRTFLEFAEKWKKEPLPVIVSGGIGRATPELVANVRTDYIDTLTDEKDRQELTRLLDDENVKEALIIAFILKKAGVDNIHVETESRNTLENIENSLALVDAEGILAGAPVRAQLVIHPMLEARTFQHAEGLRINGKARGALFMTEPMYAISLDDFYGADRALEHERFQKFYTFITGTPGLEPSEIKGLVDYANRKLAAPFDFSQTPWGTAEKALEFVKGLREISFVQYRDMASGARLAGIAPWIEQIRDGKVDVPTLQRGALKTLLDRLKQKNVDEAALIGGAVRDADPQDYDLVSIINLPPNLQEDFELDAPRMSLSELDHRYALSVRAYRAMFQTYRKLGWSSWRLFLGTLGAYKHQGEYFNGLKVDFSFTSFVVNGKLYNSDPILALDRVAIDSNGNVFLSAYDDVAADIAKQTIRVASPGPHRAFRAVPWLAAVKALRMKQQYGFNIDNDTIELFKTSFSKGSLSFERSASTWAALRYALSKNIRIAISEPPLVFFALWRIASVWALIMASENLRLKRVERKIISNIRRAKDINMWMRDAESIGLTDYFRRSGLDLNEVANREAGARLAYSALRVPISKLKLATSIEFLIGVLAAETEENRSDLLKSALLRATPPFTMDELTFNDFEAVFGTQTLAMRTGFGFNEKGVQQLSEVFTQEVTKFSKEDLLGLLTAALKPQTAERMPKITVMLDELKWAEGLDDVTRDEIIVEAAQLYNNADAEVNWKKWETRILGQEKITQDDITLLFSEIRQLAVAKRIFQDRKIEDSRLTAFENEFPEFKNSAVNGGRLAESIPSLDEQLEKIQVNPEFKTRSIRRILVNDDKEEVINSYRLTIKWMQGRGTIAPDVEVVYTERSEFAWDELEKSQEAFDLVLTDNNTESDMYGVDLVGNINALPENKRPFVVLISGDGLTSLAEQAERKNVTLLTEHSLVLEKPVEMKKIERIAQVVQGILGARLAKEKTDGKIVLNIAGLNASKAADDIKTSLGELASNFRIRAVSSSAVRPETVIQDTVYVDWDEEVTVSDVSGKLIEILLQKQQKQKVVMDFIHSALSGAQNGSEAIRVLQGELSLLSKEIPLIDKMQLYRAGTNNLLLAVKLDNEHIRFITADMENALIEESRKNENTGFDIQGMKAILSRLAGLLENSVSSPEFAAQAQFLAQEIKERVSRVYTAEAAKVLEKSEPIRVFIDADTVEINPEDIAADKQWLQNKLGEERSGDIEFISLPADSVTDADSFARYINEHGYTDRPAILISKQGGVKAVDIRTGEKSVLTLQVVRDADTLKGVLKAAVILRLNQQVMLPGVQKIDDIYLIRPLAAVLNEILRLIEIEQQSVGASA